MMFHVGAFDLALERRGAVNQVSAVQEGWVPVYVPQRHLAAVHSLLADLLAAEGRGVTPAADGPVSVTSDEAVPPEETAKYSKEALTKDEIAHLKRTFDNPSFHTLMDLLAERAGEKKSFPELMSATGTSRGELNGDLTRLTYFVRREFGKDRWPMNIDWSPEGRALYYLEPEAARWWKDA